MKFDKYFTMNEEQAIIYAKQNLTEIFNENANLTCSEIGDGNLNYVFRIQDLNSEQSIIVKQSGPIARISDDFELSPDRNRIEYEVLKYQGELAPNLVPKVYLYDPIMNCTVMDDLSDHTIMRTALLDFKTFPNFADDIAKFMVNTLFRTTDVVLEHKEKKKKVKNFINPELCEISEDLVFTEPYNDINNRNEVFEANKEFVQKELYEDEKLKLETAKLKFDFMNNAQSLLHGDLHTGSIFIKEDSTKVIDPEFAFYGPMGYDIGNVVANLMFAWARSDAYGKDEHKQWLEDSIEQMIDLFIKYFNESWTAHSTEITANYEGFREYYLDEVLTDTSAIAGMEGIRRIVGLAQVADITTIEDENKRARAERICISAGKEFIMNREVLKTGSDFVNVIKVAAEKY